MEIEQHVEAAAMIYKLAEDATDALMLEAGDGVEFWSTAPRILARHIQAATDEATAPLQVTIDCQSMEIGTLTGRVEKLKARVKALEGLEPLIDQMEKAYMALAAGGIFSSAEMWQTEAMRKRKAIDAILKGGA
jgi:hypothetical protein